MTAPAVPAPTTADEPAPSARLVGPDVTRAVALIGVVVMNYHGYLNGSSALAGPDADFFHRLFDVRDGVLSTRFAATFMLVAGVGVTLLTARSRAGGDRTAVTADRWRLLRRGFLLYWGGFALNWIWPGTILFFYGAVFMLAALVFTLRTRWLAVIGAGCAVAAALVRWWATDRFVDGYDVNWLLAPQTLTTRSPRGLVFDTFLNGTHPLLPWFGFVCLGMIVGRTLPGLARSERSIAPLVWAAGGASTTAVTYVINHVATSGRAGERVAVTVLSTRPFDRGLLYSVGAAGTALAAFGIITWLAERRAVSAVVHAFARAGQMTLTIYVLHVLVFNLLVDWLDAVPAGLGTALGFAAVFWALTIAAASWWRRVVGPGPLEVVYRRFGA